MQLIVFPKADYHIHKTLSVDLNVSHMNQGHTLTPLFCMIHSVIILASVPTCPKCSLPFRFSKVSGYMYAFLNLPQILYLSDTCDALWFVHPNNIRGKVEQFSDKLFHTELI
jgi:hypothetical protein